MLHLLVLVMAFIADDERSHGFHFVIKHVVPIFGIVVAFPAVVMLRIMMFVRLHVFFGSERLAAPDVGALHW